MPRTGPGSATATVRGSTLRDRRIKLGIPQLELADLSGCTQALVSRMERSSKNRPTRPSVRAVRRVLEKIEAATRRAAPRQQAAAALLAEAVARLRASGRDVLIECVGNQIYDRVHGPSSGEIYIFGPYNRRRRILIEDSPHLLMMKRDGQPVFQVATFSDDNADGSTQGNPSPA